MRAILRAPELLAFMLCAIAVPVMVFIAWRYTVPPFAWEITAALGLAVVVFAVRRFRVADGEFAFGVLTMLCAEAAVIAAGWAGLRHGVEAVEVRTFVIVLVLIVVALAMVAHDWSRRGLIVAAVLGVLVLGGLVARAGYHDERIPSAAERRAIANDAYQTRKQLREQERDLRTAEVTIAKARRAELVTELSRFRSTHRSATAISAAAGAIARSPIDRLVPQRLNNRYALAVALAPTPNATAAAALTKAVSNEVSAVAGVRAVHDAPRLRAATRAVRDTTPLTGQAWRDELRLLDVRLARFRADVTGAAADRSALYALLTTPERAPPISLLEAISHGPEALWRSVTGSPDALVPGPLGWLLFGLLVLGMWTWLIRINAAQMPGPVSIENDAVHTADPSQKEAVATALRIAVLQNLSEPGAAPGATSTNPVTDLLSVGTSLTTFTKILQPFLAVAGRRYGYAIDLDLATDDATPPTTTALVRVKALAGGSTMAAQVFPGTSEADAARTAGLWAAGFILNRSTRVPSWAAWNAETARALAATQGKPTAAQLTQAVREAPNSGLLLVLRGQSLEEQGDRRGALLLYARAVTAHPRYLIARYRLAAGLVMMRHESGWPTLPLAARAELCRVLTAAAKALNLSVGSEIGDVEAATASNVSARFTTLARSFLQDLRDEATWWCRIIAMLRRSDRDAIWTSVFASRTGRVRPYTLFESALLASSPSTLAKVEKMAARPGSWWQVSYNAACGYAQSNPPLAMALLEQALVRPGIHQLDAQWAETDPDLKPLASARFDAFVGQLSRGA